MSSLENRLTLLRAARAVLLVSGFALTAVSAVAQAQDDGKAAAPALPAPISKVNGVTLPASRTDLMLKQLAQRGQQDTPEVRAAVNQQLVDMELLSQQAVKKGLDKNADVVAALDMERQQILVQAFLADYGKNNPISDADLHAAYDRVKTQMAGQKEYKAHHILVKTEAEAKSIISQLNKGSGFEKLASSKSLDTGSKANGGALDWAPAAKYVKPFGDALATLGKGQTTQTPVQSPFGWHVIRVDDIRTMQVPSFEEAKAQLTQMMQQENFRKYVDDLRSKSNLQ